MYLQLNEKQEAWVNEMFSSMTMEEKVAQLLHPYDLGSTKTEIEEILKKVPVGSFFASKSNFSEMKEINQTIQKNSKIPVLISADMENGTNFIKDKGVHFPYQMALAASNLPNAAYRMGKITSLISRAAGVHWTFSPVIDLNLNPENPITNIRALGDKPEKTIPLFSEIIRGLQEDGRMAATCKHFPGDGVDNRDQHMLVSVNSLPKDQWFALYGLVWKKAIEAGTKTIMCGHISFPDYQGMQDDPDQALPATLSKKLMTDLLRNELGFQGVIVSDAFTMVGFTCRYPETELAWRNIECGSDSVLFANPLKDFENLMNALKSGKLREERVEESARRILELKASLNLHEDPFGPDPKPEDFQESENFAEQVAESSLTILRPCKLQQLPISSNKQKKILTVSLVRNDNMIDFTDLEIVDQELRARGFEVDHLTNPQHYVLREAIDKYDRIFINFTTLSHATMPLRLAGKPAMAFWRGFFAQAPEKVVYTSFGSPYLLYDYPFCENCLCTWGCLPVCQKSAVKFWCGEIGANGIMPVREHKVKIKYLDL